MIYCAINRASLHVYISVRDLSRKMADGGEVAVHFLHKVLRKCGLPLTTRICICFVDCEVHFVWNQGALQMFISQGHLLPHIQYYQRGRAICEDDETQWAISQTGVPTTLQCYSIVVSEGGEEFGRQEHYVHRILRLNGQLAPPADRVHVRFDDGLVLAFGYLTGWSVQLVAHGQPVALLQPQLYLLRAREICLDLETPWELINNVLSTSQLYAVHVNAGGDI